MDNYNKLLKGKFLSKYKVAKHFFEGNSPVTLEVHPAYNCNYNCTFCIDEYLKNVENINGYDINRDNKTMMTRQNMKDIITGCKDLGIRGIILSGGGEPTINRETEYLVKKADKNGIVIGMFTNGSLLSDRNIPTYMEGLSFIRFSFDDYSAKKYSETKGVPERFYDQVINNIKKCVEYKNEHKTDKCKIGIQFILQPSNLERMMGIYKQTFSMGVDYLQFCDCVIPGYQFTDKMQGDIINSLEDILAMNDVVTRKSGRDFKVVYEPLQVHNERLCKDCEMTDYIFLVGADGRVEPCPHLARHTELSYGNINEKSLKEIWDNRPVVLDTKMHWEYCRFREQNKILEAIKAIEHEELL